MSSNLNVKTPEPGGSDKSSAPVTSQAPIPKFSHPSEPSKWLMLWWFAGYSPAKINWLIGQNFGLSDSKAFKTENIESSFRKLQKQARRNDPDWTKDAYMWHLMKAQGKSPVLLRHSATRWLEQYHPAQALAMTENEEISEMNMWFERWSEEVALMRKSKVRAYRERACEFGEKLDSYTNHFGGKKHAVYFEENSVNNAGISSSSPQGGSSLMMSGALSTSSSDPSLHQSNPTSSIHSTDLLNPEDTPRQIIERPKLAIRTKFSVFSRKSGKPEGTPTPSSAQHLDPLGFFARRPSASSSLSQSQSQSHSHSQRQSLSGSSSNHSMILGTRSPSVLSSTSYTSTGLAAASSRTLNDRASELSRRSFGSR